MTFPARRRTPEERAAYLLGIQRGIDNVEAMLESYPPEEAVAMARAITSLVANTMNEMSQEETHADRD